MYMNLFFFYISIKLFFAEFLFHFIGIKKVFLNTCFWGVDQESEIRFWRSASEN